MRYADQVSRAAEELRVAAAGVDPAALAGMVEELAGARRVVCYGVGREGLMMRALAMRLYHMGMDAHVVGDMSCPPVGAGDVLVVSAGPGNFSTVLGLMGVAKGAGARVACVTAQPGAAVPAGSDRVLVIPAQTMADDTGPAVASVLPMGSLFEGAQYLVFEMLILMLRDRLGVSPDAMRARHTNLE
ncbi:SIS domain-containing protein [Rhodobacter sp. HX-7-19]|uniref:SIS domain-containing protein n=1 Tax=Paragemmobacter kunshanensis TaxID=2583234 RepID=A0A6M1TNI4_9RHOB|nr:SIS domain-containing protein [Rhodobacter kunshanensis]NGQ89607.1 SIS domain-containing protein [Rhodobacter kunshanensis]